MRLLLDHCVDRRIAPHLSGHEVHTARDMGWDTLRNGELLRAAAEAGFDAVITTDQGIKHQQNVDRLPIAVVVVKSQSNSLASLMPLMPRVLAACGTLQKCTLIEVEDVPGTGSQRE